MNKHPGRRIGRRHWAIPGGCVALRSTGEEPGFTSRDTLTVLNTLDETCRLELYISFGDRDPIGPYRLEVPAQRLRRFGFHELINPLPIPLDTPFGCRIRASHEVVVQFSRMDTSAANRAIMGAIAFAIE